MIIGENENLINRYEDFKKKKAENNESRIIENRSSNNSPKNMNRSMNKSINGIGKDKEMTRSSSAINIDMRRGKKKDNAFDRHEKNEIFQQTKKNEKVKKQQGMIESASMSLISNRNNKANDLADNFENARGLFDDALRVDYVKERAKKHSENRDSLKSKIINKARGEQRIEIVDYYEMNDKLINKNVKSVEDNDSYFRDVKRLNVQLSSSKKDTEEVYAPKSPMKKSDISLLMKSSSNFKDVMGLKKDLSKLELKRDTSVVGLRSNDEGKKLTKSMSSIDIQRSIERLSKPKVAKKA